MWLNPAPERPSSGQDQERLIWHESWTKKSLVVVRCSFVAIRKLFADRPILAKSERRIAIDYLLYNSTINCSFTGNWISSRLGSAITRPL